MALIRLKPWLIVDSAEIARAERSGNYTRVLLAGAPPWQAMQIWDEDEAVWSQIEAVLK